MISDKLKTLTSPSVDADLKLRGVGLFLGKTLDNFDLRVEKLEERQLLRGEKGDKGESVTGPVGPIGPKGADGRDGAPGAKGTKGDTGPVGKTGQQGISVVDAEVALDGNLVIKLSNGNIIDAGEIVQQITKSSQTFLKQLSNYQIVVSSTAPQSPQINDLWYDIS